MCNLKKSQVAVIAVLTLCGVEARGEKCLQKVLIPLTYDAADNCAILESWLSVSSNQPGGSSSSDWEVVDTHHVRLRAARSGRWGERVYTIRITAKDIHGNLSMQNVTVRVPQSKREGG